MNRTISSLSLVLGIALIGCGERAVFGYDDASVNADANRADAGDAGRDFGADAGPIDAGRADLGADAAGPDDAGSVDLGFGVDAGRTDLGVDAGRADLGVDGGRDAGSADGGLRRGPVSVILGPPTDLAQAGAYVLIGKSGITNVTGSLISGGHLGVSPISASNITGFGLILDPSNQFSTSSSVVPPARVYAADYAVPTPSNLTSAVLSMEAGYTDAAGRPTPDFLNLLGGNIAGRTLEPGLYTWGSSVNIASDITIDGGPEDTWIFQISGDLNLSAAARVVLSGGAQARNIWWQVAGQATFHATSHFEGIILCQTGITMETGASFHGRALAQSLVALDNNAITAP